MTQVTLLGTGSADGWPNPFCRCASCEVLRARGEVRGHTAALVDDRLLIDLGPDVPRSAERHGCPLDTVAAVLLTHAHADHVAPLALLSRRWAGRREPLTVAGPPVAVEHCRDWLAPDDDVRLLPLHHGDAVELAGCRVEALSARHDGPEAGPALVYRVTTPDGARLLYATDTGPLPEPTLAALRGTPVDLALLELTFGDRLDHGTDHLDLETFPQELARLRAASVVGATTEVLAVHLSHHNPPDVAALLTPWGARLVDDGTRLRVGVRTDAGASPRGEHRRTLVLGGARSGKSQHAEQLLAAEAAVTYLATGVGREDDAEWRARVTAHQVRRPAGWRTVESADVASVLSSATSSDVILVDCLTLWLTAVLDAASAWGDRSAVTDRVEQRFADLLDAWRNTPARVVAVSNEVGGGVVPATPSGRLFRDLHGRLNAELARHSEQVHLLVAGRVLDLSATRRERP